MIKEWIRNLDAADYEKNLQKYEKLPSMKNKNDPNHKTDGWPKIIMEGLNWLPFLYIMGFNADRIDNDKNLYQHF